MSSSLSRKKVAYVCLVLISILIIFFRYKYAEFDNEYLRDIFLKKEKVRLEGVIVSDPEYKKTYWRYEVLLSANLTYASSTVSHVANHFSNTKLLVKEKIRTSSIDDRPRYGDQIRFSAKIKKPEVVAGEDGRDFDYAQFLQKDNIYYLADVAEVELLSKNQASKIKSLLYKIKINFVDNIEHLLPAPHSFLAAGLIISGKGSLDTSLQEQFQKVGLIHIVVLSGSNVSIIGEAIRKIFSFLPNFWSGIFGSIGIILFGLMTGGGATVWRSVIMSIIGIWTQLTGRKNSGCIALMTAGACMLFQNPKLLLHDPSFQLSFVATLGLIFLASPIESLLMSLKFVRNYISQSIISLISTSLATQIFTLPFIVRFSGIVSLVSLPVNILVLPFVPFTMLFVFLTGVISFILEPLAYIPAFVSYILLSYELWIVGYFSSLAFSAISVVNISLATFVFMYFIIILLTIFLNFASFHKINTTPV
jgi:competence protein ComEC